METRAAEAGEELLLFGGERGGEDDAGLEEEGEAADLDPAVSIIVFFLFHLCCGF